MVARQFAPGRAVAVAIAAVMLFTITPMPTAHAQATVNDFSVKQGEAKFFQTNFEGGNKPTQFIDNGTSTIRLEVPVYQTRTTETQNVPVYWAFSGTDAPARGGCVKVNVAAATPNGPLGKGTAVIGVDTRDLAPGGYNITVSAFQKPAGAADCIAPTAAPCAATSITSCQAEPDAATGNNNTLRAFFVKERFLNLQASANDILWCPAVEGTSQACDVDMDIGDGPHNRTHKPSDQFSETYFELKVRNIGDWADMINWGGPNRGTSTGEPGGTPLDGWEYELTVSLQGLGIKNKLDISSVVSTASLLTANDDAGPHHRAQSANWNLTNMAGRYNVTVKLDGKNQLRKAATDTSTDLVERKADVLHRDFTGNITAADLRTDPTNPYPYDGSFHVAGHVTFRNIGTIGKDGPIKYVIYIDNLTNSVFNVTGEFTPTGFGADAVQVVEYDFNPTSTAGNRYIPAGHHTLRARIDCDDEPATSSGAGSCWGRSRVVTQNAAGQDVVTVVSEEINASNFEVNETNNNLSVDFYIADTQAPVLLNAPKMVSVYDGTGLNGPTRAVFFPAEPFYIYANVTDSDAGIKIYANFSLISNSSVNRSYTLGKLSGNTYVARIDDFMFHNFTNAVERTFENWTWQINASDSSALKVSSTPQTLYLKPWPIHNASGDFLVELPSSFPDSTLAYEGGNGDSARWRIHLEANQTGFWGAPASTASSRPVNQQVYTDNIELEIVTAKNKTYTLNGTVWSPRSPLFPECLDNSTQPGNNILDGVGQPEQTGTNSARCQTGPGASEVNDFQTLFNPNQPDGGAGPGKWNWSLRIKDVANYTRYVNGTLTVVDSPPTIHLVNLSTPTVAPGGNFTILVNTTDDNKEIAGVFVNFTRTSSTDARSINLTLTERKGVSGTLNEEPITFQEYNQTFKAGRRETFGLGGSFNVTVWVSDATGNWASTSLGTFNVTDEDIPTITESGVNPRTAQLGENVTFWAKARDSTNVTMRLEIFKASQTSELLLDPIVIEETADGNFTFTTNFSAEGSYAWRLTAIDSVNRPSAPPIEGNLAVRENVGPRFDVKSPSVVIDGVRYGSALPRVEIVIHDVEGVDASSIALKIANQTADFTLTPAPNNLNGYLLTHEVRSARKFNHRDVVTVNLTAKDNSTDALLEGLNFTFVVDDVAPTTRISTIAPAYRDQPAHVQNVSLNSKFTLVADDNDGMPTDVESIRYRILGGGQSAETVYTGPFKINDAPGVYTGPRLYQIQFWAEDEVGNFNRNFNSTTVYVDDTPPALFQFFPQGRNINATFVDDRVGVNRSVVWHRVNSEPFVPLPLVEKDGTWTIQLPEGVKGDRVAYYLQAWDRLDNSETFGNASAPYASFDVSNHEPKVRITAPVDGGRIFRTVDLTWEASDEDGDALVFTVYYKAPGRTTFVELAKIENSATRRYTIDTTRLPDGEYTFRLAAGDGGFVKLAETTVTVLNRASAVGVVTVPSEILPGDTMLIKAEITKAEATVEARLYLGNELVGSYPMNDQGKDGDEVANDGFFSVRVPVESAGDYSVEIYTEYREDGVTKTFASPRTDTTFSAKLTPGYILGTYGAIVALIALLAIVGIGVAVFVVMRRR